MKINKESKMYDRGYSDGLYGFTYVPDNMNEQEMVDWASGCSDGRKKKREAQ